MTDKEKVRLFAAYFVKIQNARQEQAKAHAEDMQVIAMCNRHKAEISQRSVTATIILGIKNRLPADKQEDGAGKGPKEILRQC